MSNVSQPRKVVIVIYPGVQSLDLTGPLEVFSAARRIVDGQRPDARSYELSIVSRDGAALTSSSGLQITPSGDLASAAGPLDTLLVLGGEGHAQASEDATLIEWIGRTSARARRTASVCTGAFLLARAGLLDGRRATTHWASAAALRAAYPAVEVDADPIFIRDGSTWTSAGVSAGMDLALALVEDDIDREIALLIARHLVLFLRRPGGQSQFSATLGSQQPAREPLRELQRAVLENVAGDHRVEAMASRAHMSPRHFARAFRAETGVTPARYVERVRLEAARRRLEDTEEPVALVAAGCGFGTAETMRRAFVRSLGVAPAEYRRRFAPAAGDCVSVSARGN
jgi:transcriptional regulator GlxA family with amidase domain